MVFPDKRYYYSMNFTSKGTMKQQKLSAIKRTRLLNRTREQKRNIRVINRFLRDLNRVISEIPDMPRSGVIRSTLINICVVARAERNIPRA